MSLDNGYYENFRNVLVMNLCSVLPPDLINETLKAIDITMNDFEISKKSTALITTSSIPEVVKIYIASRAVSNLSRGTLEQYKYKLFNFFSETNKPYTDIQTNDIRMYLYKFKEERKVSDCYMENIRGVLNTFFQWLTDNDYILRNPCSKVEKIKYNRKRRQPLSQYELEVCRWNTKNVREKALIDFLFATGCRVSECADVRLSDIDWIERSVLIRHGKGNKPRTVYFNAEAELAMREYLKTRTDTNDFLFVGSRSPHNPVTAHGLEANFRSISKRVGMHVYPHKLRHTFATAGLQGGMPLEELQELLGHTDPKTTLIYAKQDQENIKHDHRRVYA